MQKPKTFQCYHEMKDCYKQILHYSFIHSIFIYWRLAIWIRQKIRQKVFILYQNNTVSIKYKRQKKKKQMKFILDDCSKAHRVKKTPYFYLCRLCSSFQLFRHCLLAYGSSLITVSSAMSAGTVNTKMKKFTHYFIFR